MCVMYKYVQILFLEYSQNIRVNIVFSFTSRTAANGANIKHMAEVSRKNINFDAALTRPLHDAYQMSLHVFE